MDFSHFSFDGASTRAAEPATDVSPTTTTQLLPLPERLPTPPPCSMADLTNILDQQSLRIAVVPSQKLPNEPLTPPDDEVVLPFAVATREPRPQLSLSTTRLNSATLRMQRQASVRMQSSASHIKDISTLVEKMVQTEDQCTICDHKQTSLPSPTSDDEGISMEYTISNHRAEFRSLSYYRAGDRVEGCARVSKNARMRKRPRTSRNKC